MTIVLKYFGHKYNFPRLLISIQFHFTVNKTALIVSAIQNNSDCVYLSEAKYLFLDDVNDLKNWRSSSLV